MRCTERVTWKLTLPYVKQIANGNLLYSSGNVNGAGEWGSGFCINLEGWDGEGVSKVYIYVYISIYMYTYG